MLPDTITVLETLSLIYEDLDIDNVEEKFIDLVYEAFAFDRLALFFIKHQKNILQGKLARGFDPEIITRLEIPLNSANLLATPLISGFPGWSDELGHDDPVLRQLECRNFVLIPVVNKKRVSCWEIKNCSQKECPAYGRQWIRCWLVSGTRCCEGEVSEKHKQVMCSRCDIFNNQDIEAMEGILLADKTPSMEPIRREVVTALSIIAHTVGRAINNSKLYRKTLNEAIRDSLTGIHNRRYFTDRLMDEIDRAQRYDDPVSLILCDIDNFKIINDTHGHPAGDRILVHLSEILSQKRRKSDIVARYGGEEFALILLNTPKDEAIQIAEKIRADIEAELFEIDHRPIQITVSFGVASFHEDAATYADLVQSADRALYVAKTTGKNRVIAA